MLRLASFSALTTGLTFAFATTAPAQEIQKLQLATKLSIIDTTFKSCPNGPADRTITVGELTKLEGSLQAWQGSFAAPVPVNHTAHVFYGDGDATCPRMWVTDFALNAGTKGKWADGTAVTKFDAWSQIGDRSRTGLFENTLTSSSLLTTEQQTSCKAQGHKFNGTSYPTEGACDDVIAKDICSRILHRVVLTWKKHGTADRLVTYTGMHGFVWDGTTCTVSSRFAFSIFDAAYAPKAGDGYRTLPIPAGATDEYRVASQALLFTKPITDQSPNAAAHGQPAADSQFLFNPKMYSPSTNPLVEQLPVRHVIDPSRN
jgi:hypothetical protein